VDGFDGGGKGRILFVVARRDGQGGIDHRLVTQPAFRLMEKYSSMGWEGSILRPATWKMLESTLRKYPTGYYNAVHFDMHGTVDPDNQR
jgi:hypothetical protein